MLLEHFMHSGCLYKRLSCKTPRPFLLKSGEEKTCFGFGIPNKVSVKPCTSKTIRLGIRLYAPNGCELKASRMLVKNKNLSVTPLFNAVSERCYIHSLALIVRNLSKTQTITFHPNFIMATVSVDNYVHSRHSIMQCDQLDAKFNTQENNETISLNVNHSQVRFVLLQEGYVDE